MGLTRGSVATPRELKSSGVSVQGEGCHIQGSHMWGARDTGQTRDRAHARRAADGFVRVDVAQSALREARSPGTPCMHGHPGGLLVLVSLSWPLQPVCVSGCDVKYKFPVRREWHACDSQGRFEWVFDFTQGELWAEASFSHHGKQEMLSQDCDSHNINELFCHSFGLNQALSLFPLLQGSMVCFWITWRSSVMVIVKWLLLWFFFPPAWGGWQVTCKVIPRPSQPNCSNSKFLNLSFQKVLDLQEFYETLSLVSSKYSLCDGHISLCRCSMLYFHGNVTFYNNCALEYYWIKWDNHVIKLTCNTAFWEIMFMNYLVKIQGCKFGCG